jgi:membrane peptidoglycan carboxypeptidase
MPSPAPAPKSAPPASHRPAGRLARLLGQSALAGVLLAAVALPVVGGTGWITKAAADSYLQLPSQLDTPPLPQGSKMLAADGSTIAIFYSQDRQPVPLADVPVVTRQAFVDIEDSRFYDHPGVDVRGTFRALVADLSGGSRQGGSTLTQQYVKNVLVETADSKQAQEEARAPTLSRKIREARYAIALDRKYSKDQILERYLNIAYFGDGAYGIAAAARHFFGVPVQQLTLAQSAMLAGLVEGPAVYDPLAHPDKALGRRTVVLDRMAQLGDVTPAQSQQAAAGPLALAPTKAPQDCAASSAPFFCDYVKSSLLADRALGATPEARSTRLYAGGLTIKTTLVPVTQQAAQDAVDGAVPRESAFAAAVDVVQPGTGAVTAMAVNRSYGDDAKANQTKVNLATGGGSGFQAGSTFKVFVLANAIQQGLPLSTTINAPQTYTSTKFSDYQGGRVVPYTVSNAGDSEAGRFDLVQATWESVNTYYVQLEERTGLDGPASLAESLGVRRADGKPLARVPSFTLGTNEVSPLAMAGAYAAFAAHGTYCPPRGVDAINDAAGRPVGSFEPKCTAVLAPDVADKVTSVLRGVVEGPDSARTGVGAQFDRSAAGKTGTTEGYGAAWFTGFTPDLAAAVWLGDPAGGNGHPLKNVTINGRYYTQVYGGDLPAAIWRRTLSTALADAPESSFTGGAAEIAASTPQPDYTVRIRPRPTPGTPNGPADGVPGAPTPASTDAATPPDTGGGTSNG